MTTVRRGVPATLVSCAIVTAIIGSLGALVIPAISRAYHVPVTTGQWMLTVNLLVGAIVTPIQGRLSDGRHYRGVLIAGLAITCAGSAVAALAPNFSVFLVGRALQGCTYGVIPVCISVGRRYLPPERRRQGLGAVAVASTTGAGLGFMVTGFVAQYASFRWAFGLAAIAAVPPLIGVLAVLPRPSGDEEPRVGLDLTGAALLGLGAGSLLLAIGRGGQWGWLTPVPIGLAGSGIAAVAAWAAWERRAAHPLIRLGVFAHRDVRLSAIAACAVGATLYMSFTAVTQIAEAPRWTGYGLALPLAAAGSIVVPMAFGSQIGNRLAVRWLRDAGGRVMLGCALACMGVTALALTALHSYIWADCAAMFVFGLGSGFEWAALPTLVLGAVSPEDFGATMSFNYLLTSVGGSAGSAVAGAILAAHAAHGGLPRDSGYQVVFVISAVCCAAPLIAQFGLRLAGRPSPKPVPAEASATRDA